MKLRWWVLSWIAAVAAGVGVARWWAVDAVLIPAAAQPAPDAPAPVLQPAPPLQASAAAPPPA